MAEKKPNPNAGHRERMRQRFLANGFNGFQPHEIIEILLFNALPRCDTNKIAHELIDRFHTVAGVLEADIQDLCQVKGININSAVYLTMMPALFREYQLSKIDEKVSFADYNSSMAYLKALYISETREKAYVICLDAQAQVLGAEIISTGTATSAAISTRRIAEAALRYKCDRVVLVHNHPDGNPQPSSKDIYATNSVRKSLSAIEIKLEDHFIVGRYVFSFRKFGYFDT